MTNASIFDQISRVGVGSAVPIPESYPDRKSFKEAEAAHRMATSSFWSREQLENFDEVSEACPEILDATCSYVLRPSYAEEDRGFWKEVERIGLKNIKMTVGAAGTGKTTILARKALELKGKVMVSAVSGVAAQRTQQVIKNEAASQRISWDTVKNSILIGTIHSVFNLPVSKSFNLPAPESRTKTYHKVAHYITDEAFMIPSGVAWRMAEKIKAGRTWNIFGDPNQLQPVGAGQPFFWLMRLLMKKHPENIEILRKVYRTSSESTGLQEAANDILAGRMPKLSGPGWEIIVRQRQSMISHAEYEGVEHKRQVLSPFRLFAFRAGYRVESRLNKHTTRKEIDKKTGLPRAFCPGDLLTSTITSYRDGLKNGMQVTYVRKNADGTHACRPMGETLTLKFPRGLESKVVGDVSDAEEETAEILDKEVLIFSRALTISRAQGQEFQDVAIFIPQESRFIDRNLIYTAVTRAKRSCVLYVDSLETLQACISRTKEIQPTTNVHAAFADQYLKARMM